MYDDTNSLVGRNKELPKVAERIFQNVQEVVEAKGSVMPITAEGKGEKSRVIVSCKHLEGNYKEHIEKEGVRLADSAETLGVDQRTRTVKLGAQEKDTMTTCGVRFVIAKRNRVIESNWMNTGVRKLLRTGLVPAKVRGGQAPGIPPTERLELRRQMAAIAGEKSSTSFLLFWT